MKDQSLIAFFQNKRKLRKAITSLMSSGVSRSDIHIIYQAEEDMFENHLQRNLQFKVTIVAIVSAAIGGVVGSLATNMIKFSPVFSATLGILFGTLMGTIIGSLIGAEITERESIQISDDHHNSLMLKIKVHNIEEEKNTYTLLGKEGAIRIENAA